MFVQSKHSADFYCVSQYTILMQLPLIYTVNQQVDLEAMIVIHLVCWLTFGGKKSPILVSIRINHQ